MNSKLENMLLEAEFRYSENNIEEAYKLLKNRFEIDSDYSTAYGFMAKVLYKLRKFEESEDFLNKAILSDPEDFEIQYIQGKIRFKQKKYNTAKEFFIASKKINQFFDENYYYLGLTEEIAGNKIEAQKLFIESFKISNGVNFKALQKIKNNKESLKIIEKTLFNNEGLVPDKVWINLGYILTDDVDFFSKFLNWISNTPLSDISRNLIFQNFNLNENDYDEFLDLFLQYYDFSDEITPKLNKLLNLE